MLQTIVFWDLNPFLRKIICAASQQNPPSVPRLNSKCKDPKSQSELRIGFIWYKKENKWISDFPSSCILHEFTIYRSFISESQCQREADKKADRSWIIGRHLLRLHMQFLLTYLPQHLDFRTSRVFVWC